MLLFLALLLRPDAVLAQIFDALHLTADLLVLSKCLFSSSNARIVIYNWLSVQVLGERFYRSDRSCRYRLLHDRGIDVNSSL
jgi:hypothetical protein